MGSKLIKLQDGILAEVETPEDQMEEISEKLLDRVDSGMEDVKKILKKTCKPILETWEELSKDAELEQAQVELGLGFEAEGNLFLAKSKGSANIKITLTMRPK